MKSYTLITWSLWFVALIAALIAKSLYGGHSEVPLFGLIMFGFIILNFIVWIFIVIIKATK